MRVIRPWRSCPAMLALALALGPAGAAASPADDNTFSSAVEDQLDRVCASSGPQGPQLLGVCAALSSASFAYNDAPTHLTGLLGVTTLNRQIPTYLATRAHGTPRADARGLDGDSAHGSAVMGKLGVFGSFDYEGSDHRSTRFETGTTANAFAGTFGADYALTSWLIAGAAFTVTGQTGSFDGDRGDFDTLSYGLTLYASIVPLPNLFVDVLVGGALKDYNYSRTMLLSGVGVQGIVDADTTGDEVRVSVLTGYDYVWGSVTIGPRVGVNYAHNTIDAFTERGRTGLELAFDDQHHSSLTLTLGVTGTWAVSTPFGVLVPQASVEYVHEFMDDQRVVYFRFAQDGNRQRMRFLGDRPDRNYFHMGLGASLQLAKGVTPFVGYRALVGYKDHSVHSFAAGVRIAF